MADMELYSKMRVHTQVARAFRELTDVIRDLVPHEPFASRQYYERELEDLSWLEERIYERLEKIGSRAEYEARRRQRERMKARREAKKREGDRDSLSGEAKDAQG